MRKLISMSLMALLLSVMAMTAMAGNVEDCEVLKDGDYSKGLYGLCIAWHNAGNDNARDKILNNYNKKAGPDDPDLPGSGGVECVCWDMQAIVDAAASEDPFECQPVAGAFGEQFAVYPSQAFYVEDLFCFHQDFIAGSANTVFFDENTESDRIDACRTDIETVCP